MTESKTSTLDSPVKYLKFVGPKRAVAFEKAGIKTIKDLLFYFPTRHLDRTTILTVAQAYQHALNGFDGEITIIGKVVSKELIRTTKREILKVHFKDQTGFFECVWFSGIKYFYNVFNENEFFAICSKPEIDKYDHFYFIHPDYDKISEDETNSFLHTGKIIPFYRIPKELKLTNLGDLGFRKIINNAAEKYADKIEETLPEYILKKHSLLTLSEAVKNYHYPENSERLLLAKRRMKFEEIFFLELLVALKKSRIRKNKKNHRYTIRTDLIKKFLSIIPFQLTRAQLKVLSEIKKDMLSEFPMNRLLQGDVGSGKTIVALISMLIAIDNGYQTALMVPTEILADQHYKNISTLIEKLNEINPNRKIRVSLLLGGQSKTLRNKILKSIEEKETDIIIGTHALIEENVNFKNLSYVVIDEQHRFGVRQRADLISKGLNPDVLVMSATPIPRTITMTLYGDLDVSIIDEMPQNRKKIITVLRGEKKLPEIYQFIKDKAKENYQTFIVYPLVEESDKLDLKAATKYYDELSNTHLKELRLGLIHGRMTWQEKEEMMFKFLHKEFNVLVATTVIEVGIDIPDANIILINDAHRFGLSQLHQLRGRVGRGSKQAYCILVTNDKIPASQNLNQLNLEYLSEAQLEFYKASVRLQSMVEHLDGFKIAEIDMKLRGPGDIFGIKQSGFSELKFVSLVEDEKLIYEAKKSAFEIISEDSNLSEEKNFLLRRKIISDFKDTFIFSKIG
jgi:ATP-dependent DNA helicase RecG